MLARLGRWLGAAGYDTRITGAGKSDAELIEMCRAEARVLLSRERGLVGEAQASVEGVLLIGRELQDDIAFLTHARAIDWTVAPFTRCLIENTELREGTVRQTENIPLRSRGLPGPFRACARHADVSTGRAVTSSA